jgi:hypothetical protein
MIPRESRLSGMRSADTKCRTDARGYVVSQLRARADQKKNTVVFKCLSTRASFCVVVLRYLLFSWASRRLASKLHLFSWYIQFTPPVSATSFWSFAKRPPTGHAAGMPPSSGIDRCNRGGAAMIRSGFIRVLKCRARQQWNGTQIATSVAAMKWRWPEWKVSVPTEAAQLSPY